MIGHTAFYVAVYVIGLDAVKNVYLSNKNVAKMVLHTRPHDVTDRTEFCCIEIKFIVGGHQGTIIKIIQPWCGIFNYEAINGGNFRM